MPDPKQYALERLTVPGRGRVLRNGFGCLRVWIRNVCRNHFRCVLLNYVRAFLPDNHANAIVVLLNLDTLRSIVVNFYGTLTCTRVLHVATAVRKGLRHIRRLTAIDGFEQAAIVSSGCGIDNKLTIAQLSENRVRAPRTGTADKTAVRKLHKRESVGQ